MQLKHRSASLRALAVAVLFSHAYAHSESFKFPTQTLTVPDGFTIEQVAEPSLVPRPIVADLDDEGRLYVADSSGSNEKIQLQLEKRPHRILRIEDTNGDGKYDKSTVFADHMMFPEGAMWHDGSLFVAAPPSIWKLTDTDGDGIADQREEWFKGKTLTGCANDLHGPYKGRDGWIYWAKGAFAEQTYSLPNQPGFVTKAAHLFRARPDGSSIEPVMTGGMDNPVEIAFTLSGERIFTTTFFQHPGGGRRDGLIHAIYGGVYGKDHEVLDGHKRTGELMPVLTHFGAAAPSGLATYESAVFGGEFTGNLFSAQFNLHKVQRHVLTPHGATFQTKDIDFVTSDNTDFHPTDVLEDADGSLLVVDTGGWYKLCCPTSQLSKPDVLGGIYRVRSKTPRTLSNPRGKNIVWASLQLNQIETLIDDPRPAVNRKAIEKLAQLANTSNREEFFQTVQKWVRNLSARGRRNIVWAMTRSPSAVARDLVQIAMNNQDESTAVAAMHSASVNRDSKSLSILISRIKNGSPAVRRAAAEAIGRLGQKSSVPHLLQAAGKITDRTLEHSIAYALIEINDPTATALGLSSTNAAVVRASLIALDQMESSPLKAATVIALLGSPEPSIRDAASWVLSHHTDWGADLAQNLGATLESAASSQEQLERVGQQLASLAGSTAIQQRLAQAVSSPAVPEISRFTALKSMSRAGLRETPPDWFTALNAPLTEKSLTLKRQAIRTARSLPRPKNSPPGCAEALKAVATDATLDDEARVEALDASIQASSTLSAAEFQLLAARLSPATPVTTRSAASAILSRAALSIEQKRDLIKNLHDLGPLELTRVLGVFENGTDDTMGAQLIEALKQSKSLASLPADTLRQRTAKMPQTTKAAAEGLIASLHSDLAKQKERLESLLSQMRDGDVRRGQLVFNSPKAACSACHAIGYLGGQIGPDLTSIGQIRTERDLLESILYPSASFVRSFEPVIVETKSGEEHSGVLRKDSPEEVLIATGPGAEVRLARTEIAEMRPGTLSTMPQGLEEQLSRQELADLLAFLKNTKWGAQ